MIFGSYAPLLAVFLFSFATAFFLVLMVRNAIQLYRARIAARYQGVLAQRTEELAKERVKIDNLLSRMLPATTANELQKTGSVQTARYQMVSVLFADIEGFSLIAESLNPERLIESLDRLFFDLDSLVARYNVEKIKTVGDGYLCAGGLPRPNRTNPVEVVLVALEMQAHMQQLNRTKVFGTTPWRLRIGVNTGAVVSGVVGRDKLSYDIWGTAVNVASRMQSASAPGKVSISSSTFFYIKDFFQCTERGSVAVKSFGQVDMYYVDGIRPDLSKGGQGLEPNHEFDVQLQLLRLDDLEVFVLDMLEKKLPPTLYYHNLKHTIDVYTQAEIIGQAEGVSTEEILLLRTAALFHDSGHIIDYKTHEEMGVKLACEILPKFFYTKPQIRTICALIMATKMPVNPQNLLEGIICDADCDYLGRRDYLPVAESLYRELKVRGFVTELSAWVDTQIAFLSQHHYYTKTAQNRRERNKQQQLQSLQQLKAKALAEEAARAAEGAPD